MCARLTVSTTVSPWSRNSFAISTPASTRPPGLSRKSSTMRSAPAALSFSSAAASSRSAALSNSSRRTYPTRTPFSRFRLVSSTGSSSMRLRGTSTLIFFPSDDRMNEMAAGGGSDPFGTATGLSCIRLLTSNGLLFSTLDPSTSTISSPCPMPATSAVLPVTSPTTRRLPTTRGPSPPTRSWKSRSEPMFRPMPVTSYLDARRLVKSSGSKKRV